MGTEHAEQIDFRALAERLTENFQPARRIWTVNLRLAFWLMMQLAILAFVASLAPRTDLLMQLGNPLYLLQLGPFILIGSVAAWLALRTAIPSREATRAELILILFAAVIAVIPLLFEPAVMEVSWVQFVQVGARCLACTMLLAALPWFALFWAVRRGATLMAETAGWLTGAAAFCFAFAASRLGCPIDNSLHVLTWHVLPVAAGTALSLLAGVLWLQRKRSSIEA